MINPKDIAYALIYQNSKEAFQKTGVVRAVQLVLNTEPETRLTLWHVRCEEIMTYEASTYEVDAGGHTQHLPSIYGGLAAELADYANSAQGRLAEFLRSKGRKPQYGHIYRVQKGLIEDLTDSK